MKALGIALVIVGYALFYTGASNLFTAGQGWGFLQALLNKGTGNQSGKVGSLQEGSKGSSGGSSGKSLGEKAAGGLSDLFEGLGTFIPGL